MHKEQTVKYKGKKDYFLLASTQTRTHTTILLLGRRAQLSKVNLYDSVTQVLQSVVTKMAELSVWYPCPL